MSYVHTHDLACIYVEVRVHACHGACLEDRQCWVLVLFPSLFETESLAVWCRVSQAPGPARVQVFSCLPVVLGLAGAHSCSQVHVSTGDLNSGSHTWVASALPRAMLS